MVPVSQLLTRPTWSSLSPTKIICGKRLQVSALTFQLPTTLLVSYKQQADTESEKGRSRRWCPLGLRETSLYSLLKDLEKKQKRGRQNGCCLETCLPKHKASERNQEITWQATQTLQDSLGEVIKYAWCRLQESQQQSWGWGVSSFRDFVCLEIAQVWCSCHGHWVPMCSLTRKKKSFLVASHVAPLDLTLCPPPQWSLGLGIQGSDMDGSYLNRDILQPVKWKNV